MLGRGPDVASDALREVRSTDWIVKVERALRWQLGGFSMLVNQEGRI